MIEEEQSAIVKDEEVRIAALIKSLPEGSIPIRYKVGGLDEIYNIASFTNVDRDNDFFNYPNEIPEHILSKVKEIVITLAGNARALSWLIYAVPEDSSIKQPIYKQVLSMANYNLKIMIADPNLLI